MRTRRRPSLPSQAGYAYPPPIHAHDGGRLHSEGFEKFDLDMNSDYNKTRAHDLKEDLHYVIDEKNQQADLTEKGRR